MRPHLEEAWRALRLASHDVHAFHVLRRDPDTHPAVVGFHAQQAIEKLFKGVLFSRQIEFTRTHNLAELTSLLRRDDLEVPVSDDKLLRLNPFAVAFRYDEMDIEFTDSEEIADCIATIREWAWDCVHKASEAEQEDGSPRD